MKIPAFFSCGLFVPNYFKHLRISAVLAALVACLGFVPLTSSAIVDLPSDPNGPDGLDDVWEAYYGAQLVLPGDDDDNDGETNMEECIAGTDPFDAASCHDVNTFTGDGTAASVTFDTFSGKCYRIQVGTNLSDFANLGEEMHGTGSPLTVGLATSGPADLTGSATHEVWTGIAGTGIGDLTGNANYPGNPSGVQALPAIQISSNSDDNYGGRIRGFIKPPANGSYTFYLAAGSDAEFYLSSDDTVAGLALEATVTGGAVAAEEWTKFASQTSGAVALAAGQKYYFEVLHKEGAGDDHCAVGWEGPGLPAGIQVVDGDYLCPASGSGIANPDGTDQVVYYPLDGDAADATGGNDGTLVGSPVFKAPGAGALSGAITLDGVDDQVDIADSADINTGGPYSFRSIALWFKADAPNGARQVIFEEGGGTNGLNIYLDSGVLHVGAYVNNGVNFNTYLNVPLTDTNWHHVAIVLDAGTPGSETFKGYLDGSEFGSAAAGVMNAHGGDIAIGALRQDTKWHDGVEPLDTGFFFAGCVDEFHLFNRALGGGEISALAGNGLDTPGAAPIPAGAGFIRVTVKDLDQDGDGLSDYAEKLMGGDGNYSPFDTDSTSSGGSDIATVSAALGATSETVEVVATDAEAYEDPRDDAAVLAGTPVADVGRDPARFRIQRTGSLQPLTVDLTLAGDLDPLINESADPSDYSATKIDGSPFTGAVSLSFGQVSTEVVVVPVNDTDNSGPTGIGNEFPEQVSCTVNDMPAYDPGASDQAEIVIYDARDIESQETLFVAYSAPEPGAQGPQGSGVVSGQMNGKKDHMKLNTVISSGFSSPQDDSHLHKANSGPMPGPIVYEITTIPGEDSDPLLGEIGPDYPYPIEAASGNSAQQIVDGFYKQNGETPMYLNWHTVNNGSGELWAIFNKAEGSIDPPVHPDPPAIGLLSGDALERDIYRFLNQATFGATDAEVQVIKTAIETERTTGGNPSYSRIEEYESWIDAQVGLDQTYLLDYLIAVKFQEWRLRDYYDPTVWYNMAEFPNNPALPPDDPAQTWTVGQINPIAPATSLAAPLMMPPPDELGNAYPAIDRNATPGDPLQWRPTDAYPLSSTHRAWGDDNDNRGDPLQLPRQRWNGSNYVNNSYDKWARRDLARPNERSRYLIHWMMAVNAHDQLRQKMGFALQQIDVVANTLTIIQDRDLGMANYQDQINRMAFGKYRDIIDFIMTSPQMGWWLSSFNNQKAADIDDDGTIDIFPDENLAREVMQLFTCGLFMLHPDGSLALDSANGLPQPSYTNDDITELSRIITGHGYGKHINGNGLNEWNNWNNVLENTSFARGAGDSRVEHTFNFPMKMFGDFHDTDPKTILGGKVVDNTHLAADPENPTAAEATAIGLADMKDALDWLSGIPGDGNPDFDQVHSHQSTAPFIASRLIQRFVTSNPSPAYVERVSEAFTSGEGDLLAAVKAILLDWEARDPAARTQTAGMKKSPYEAYVHLLRAFDAHSMTPLNPYDGSEPASFIGNGNYDEATNPDLYLQNYGYPATQRDNFRLNTQFRFNQTHSSTNRDLSMSPMNQPTVFNFYLPDYSPGGVISDSALVSPEMQLANETALWRNINFFYSMAVSTSAKNSGESELDLVNVQDAFQNTGTGANHANQNERIKIDTDVWGPLLYPATGTELERDTALFDEIDRRLTGGLFKELYPWDPSDDELTDPTIDINGDGEVPDNDGINPAFATTGDGNINNDSELMNPREAIIRFMGEAYGTTGTGPRDKFRFGLYLISISPDFLVRQ